MKKILIVFLLMMGVVLDANSATVSVAGQTTVVNGATQIAGLTSSWWLFNVGSFDKQVTFQLNDTAPDGLTVNYELWTATNISYPAADTDTHIDSWTDIDTSTVPGGSLWKTFTFLANTSYLLGFSSPQSASFIVTDVSAVPVPAAIWLFGSALMGLVGFSRRKFSSAVAV